MFDVFAGNFFSFDRILKTRNKISIVYSTKDGIIHLNSNGLFGYFYLLTKLLNGRETDRMLNRPLEFSTGYFSYPFNVLRSLKETKKQAMMVFKLEKFLSRFVKPAEMRNVFGILERLFGVLSTQMTVYEGGGFVGLGRIPQNKEDFDFQKIKEYLDRQADRRNENNDEMNDYIHILTNIYHKENEIQRLFSFLISFSNSFSVCDMSLYDLFTSDSFDYSSFVYYIFGLFMHSTVRNTEKETTIVFKELENFHNNLLDLCHELYLQKDILSQKINSYNTIPTLNFLSDFYEVTTFFGRLEEEFARFDFTCIDSEISFGSSENGDIRVEEDSLSYCIDIETVKEVMNKFHFIKIKKGHNFKIPNNALIRAINK